MSAPFLASFGDVVSEDDIEEELLASLLDGEPDFVISESFIDFSASPLIPTGSADMLTSTGFS